MTDTYAIVLDFVKEALSPKFKITSKGTEYEALKPYVWWDISAVDVESSWAPALISFRKNSGKLVVAAGYSSQHKTVISIADPNAAAKILEAVKCGWDESPNLARYRDPGEYEV